MTYYEQGNIVTLADDGQSVEIIETLNSGYLVETMDGKRYMISLTDIKGNGDYEETV